MLPPIDFYDWICTHCQRYNHKQRSLCSNCKHHKHSSDSSSSTLTHTLQGTISPVVLWRCLLCHGSNSVSDGVCKFCKAGRPSTNAVYHTWRQEKNMENGFVMCVNISIKVKPLNVINVILNKVFVYMNEPRVELNKSNVVF